jgi:hypothetical protein
MKLKNLIPQCYRQQVIRQFGGAKLVRLPNGQHELIGGSDRDRADAFEWTSLFAHEIVFTHFHRGNQACSIPRQPWLAPRLTPSTGARVFVSP